MAKILSGFVLVLLPLFGEEHSFAVRSLRELHNDGVVRQQYEESCGAAALATLLNLWKAEASEEEILSLAEGKTEMMSFLELAEIAQKLGFQERGYKIKREVFEKLTIPVIAKVERDPRSPHFLVAQNFAEISCVSTTRVLECIRVASESFTLFGMRRGMEGMC